jgi:hypothetical protein
MSAHKRKAIGLLVFAASLVAANVSQAATTYNWTNTAGSVFSAPGNWNPAGGPPGPADEAEFNVAGTYRVAWNAGVTNNLMDVRSGALTFDTGAHTYVTTNFYLAYNNTDRADILFTNGIIETRGLTYLGYRGNGNLTITNGAVFRHLGTAAGNPFFQVCSDAAGTTPPQTNIATVTGPGSLLEVRHRFYVGPYSTAKKHYGAMRVLNGGHVLLLYSINMFSHHAALEVDGTNSLFESTGPITYRFGTNTAPVSMSITRSGKVAAYSVSFGGLSDFSSYITVLIDGAGSELYTTGYYIAFGGDVNGTMTKGGRVEATLSHGGRATTPTSGSGNMYNWIHSVLTLDNGHTRCRYFYNTGRIQGNGTMYAGTKFGNAGTISPGTASTAGRISTTNAYEHFMNTASFGGIYKGGTLEVDLGGTHAVSQYDVLAVVGNVALTSGTGINGIITARLMNGFLPADGDTFDVLTATGTITPANLTDVTFNMPTAKRTTWSRAVVNITGGKAVRITAHVAPPPGTSLMIR